MPVSPDHAESAASPDAPASGSAPTVSAPASPVLARPRPTPRPRIELCPYCGRESINTTRCSTCGGLFDALSKQATQNAMGPWWLREGERPLRPGCSYDTIRSMVTRGTITLDTVLRGPTSRQFWTRARRVPGVAHLLGLCHSCQREVSPEAFMCQACGASFNTETDRQHLGLSPIALLPGQAAADRIAAVSAASVPVPRPAGPLPTVAALALGPSAVSTFQPTLANLAAMPDGSSVLQLERWDAPRSRRSRPLRVFAFIIIGALLASGGIFAALVAAQGSVSQSLVVLGIRQPVGGSTNLARGGPAATPRSPTSVPPASSEPTVPGVHPPDPAASDPASNLQTPDGDILDPSQATAIPPPVAPPTLTPAARLAALHEQLRQSLESSDPARFALALSTIEQADRDHTLTADEASAWRVALQSRLDRASLGNLP